MENMQRYNAAADWMAASIERFSQRIRIYSKASGEGVGINYKIIVIFTYNVINKDFYKHSIFEECFMFFKKIHFANPGMTEYIFATLYGRQFSEKLYETLRE